MAFNLLHVYENHARERNSSMKIPYAFNLVPNNRSKSRKATISPVEALTIISVL